MSDTLTPPLRAWVDALRSGEYEQCCGALSKQNKYCCLGVACEVYMKASQADPDMAPLTKLSSPGSEYGLMQYDGCSTGLPNAVIAWLGLKAWSDCGSLKVENWSDPSSLIEMNDANNSSFNQIADTIEAGKLKMQGDYEKTADAG